MQQLSQVQTGAGTYLRQLSQVQTGAGTPCDNFRKGRPELGRLSGTPDDLNRVSKPVFRLFIKDKQLRETSLRVYDK